MGITVKFAKQIPMDVIHTRQRGTHPRFSLHYWYYCREDICFARRVVMNSSRILASRALRAPNPQKCEERGDIPALLLLVGSIAPNINLLNLPSLNLLALLTNTLKSIFVNIRFEQRNIAILIRYILHIGICRLSFISDTLPPADVSAAFATVPTA